MITANLYPNIAYHLRLLVGCHSKLLRTLYPQLVLRSLIHQRRVIKAVHTQKGGITEIEDT